MLVLRSVCDEPINPRRDGSRRWKGGKSAFADHAQGSGLFDVILRERTHITVCGTDGWRDRRIYTPSPHQPSALPDSMDPSAAAKIAAASGYGARPPQDDIVAEAGIRSGEAIPSAGLQISVTPPRRPSALPDSMDPSAAAKIGAASVYGARSPQDDIGWQAEIRSIEAIASAGSQSPRFGFQRTSVPRIALP